MIVSFISRKMIPFIQLYALYVIAHGDLGPGGGFQGGVIMGTSFILYVIAFSLDKGKQRVSVKLADSLGSAGVLIYAGVGVLCVLAGGSYLEYGSLPFADRYLAHHLGIYAVEIGVSITVTAVMVTFMFDIARKKDD